MGENIPRENRFHCSGWTGGIRPGRPRALRPNAAPGPAAQHTGRTSRRRCPLAERARRSAFCSCRGSSPRHHSQTLPCMSYRPQALAGKFHRRRLPQSVRKGRRSQHSGRAPCRDFIATVWKAGSAYSVAVPARRRIPTRPRWQPTPLIPFSASQGVSPSVDC